MMHEVLNVLAFLPVFVILLDGRILAKSESDPIVTGRPRVGVEMTLKKV